MGPGPGVFALSDLTPVPKIAGLVFRDHKQELMQDGCTRKNEMRKCAEIGHLEPSKLQKKPHGDALMQITFFSRPTTFEWIHGSGRGRSPFDRCPKYMAAALCSCFRDHLKQHYWRRGGMLRVLVMLGLASVNVVGVSAVLGFNAKLILSSTSLGAISIR